MVVAKTSSRHILGMRIDAGDYEFVTKQVLEWSQSTAPRYVCVANVHMTMEAFDSNEYRTIVNGADFVTSDGMPLVWLLRRLGLRDAQRVYGPTLTLNVCEAAASEGVPVGFYGGSQDTVDALRAELLNRFSGLDVRFAFSPPFRPLTAAEDDSVVSDIVASGARILFVGLGCPKQERWMAQHKDRLPLVQLGVGAAFDFHAGRVRQAPNWMQELGLEWLFRLAVEPRRLWKRYLYNNPRFIAYSVMQLLGRDFNPHGVSGVTTKR